MNTFEEVNQAVPEEEEVAPAYKLLVPAQMKIGVCAATHEQLQILHAITRDKPAHSTRIELLQVVGGQKIADLEEAIDARRFSGTSAMLAVVQRNQAKNLADEARTIVDEMERDEKTVVEQGSVKARGMRGLAFLVVLVGSGILLLLIGANTIVIRRDLRLNYRTLSADKVNGLRCISMTVY